MPRRKIPHEAFTYYMSLGPARSYALVARNYGVTKRAVVRLATQERWQAQAAELERKAREKTNAKVEESLEEMNDRHLKIARVVQNKALEALRQYPLQTALQAVRALEGAVRQERAIKGEPADGAQASVEELIKREYARWMSPPGDAPIDAAPDEEPERS